MPYSHQICTSNKTCLWKDPCFPDPTESIVEGSQFYLLPSYTRRDVAISGKNTALLKSVMTSGAAIKTQPEPGVEIERISIHLPTSEGIVRITPETLHLFQLEVLPLMYRNGCGKHFYYHNVHERFNI